MKRAPSIAQHPPLARGPNAHPEYNQYSTFQVAAYLPTIGIVRKRGVRLKPQSGHLRRQRKVARFTGQCRPRPL